MKKEDTMKDRIHEQMASDMKQGVRTDTIVVIVTIFINLLFLGINSGVAATIRENGYIGPGSERITSINVAAIAILLILMALVIVINFVVLRVLSRGKERRAKLMAGLMKMYKEEGMEKYYDPSLEQGYDARYNLLSIVVVSIGAAAILVPILVSATGC
jgi:hypothetical protein